MFKKIVLFFVVLLVMAGFVVGGCGDNIKNQDETDVDCGGSCEPCAEGNSCSVNADCESLDCTNNVCQSTGGTCGDSIKNQDETDVDCGGSFCTACVDGKNCLGNVDCMNNNCVNGECVSQQTNILANLVQDDQTLITNIVGEFENNPTWSKLQKLNAIVTALIAWFQ